MDYYVRFDAYSTPILGPVSFTIANAAARRASLDENRGVAQVYTILGERQGDPPQHDKSIQVVSIYRSGKLLIGGRIANERSRLNLPPDLPANNV